MSAQRLLLLAAFWLALPSAGWGQAAQAGRTVSPQSISLNKGTLQLTRGAGAVISNMKLRLRYGDGSSVTGELEPAGQDAGEDTAGRYERLRFRLKSNAPARVQGQERVEATIEVRRYLRPEVIVASTGRDRLGQAINISPRQVSDVPVAGDAHLRECDQLHPACGRLFSVCSDLV